MNLIEFIRLILKNIYWLVAIPLLMGCLVFFMTRNTKKEYASAALLYTGLASGYSITSGEDSRVDYFAVNNAFDNIMTLLTARETLEEVCIRLLAVHLSLDKPDSSFISRESFVQLHEWLHPEEIQASQVAGNSDATFNLIKQKLERNEAVPIKKLLNTPNIPYNVEHLQKNLSIQRKSSSDMLEIVFSSNDPGMCKTTLDLLVNVFMRRYKKVKTSETTKVVEYFEEQVQQALARLKSAEDRLKDFGVENKIINYNEQTKFISEAKEELGKVLQSEEMALAQSRAALAKLEESLDKRTGVLESSDKILQYRKELSQLNFQIAQKENQEGLYTEVVTLKEKVKQLKLAVQSEVNQLYKLSFTQEGLSQQTLLNEWVSNFLEIDARGARIEVIKKRINSYDAIYDEFAPLGSTLNRLEREVGVVEREYLSLLHGLNQAKLRQQNLEMSNNLKVIDGPYYPEKPKKSKRLILVVGAAVVSVTLYLGGIVFNYLIDQSLKNPKKAVQKVGIKLAGALPVNTLDEKYYDVQRIQYKSLQLIANRIELELKGADDDTFRIGVTGANAVPDLNQITSTLVGYLNKYYHKSVGILSQNTEEVQPYLTSYSYEGNSVDYDKLELEIEELRKGENMKFVFIVLPSIDDINLPIAWINQFDMTLVVADAKMKWSDSDKLNLYHYQQAALKDPLLLLDQVTTDNLEEIIGEIPKRRSFIRKLTKRFLKV